VGGCRPGRGCRCRGFGLGLWCRLRRGGRRRLVCCGSGGAGGGGVSWFFKRA